MKKINLITALVFAPTLTSSLFGIASCSCNPQSIDAKLTTDSSSDVSIKDSNIIKGKDSTITLTTGEWKQVNSLEIKIGTKTLSDTEYSFDYATKKITIKGDVVDGNAITIKAITIDVEILEPTDEVGRKSTATAVPYYSSESNPSPNYSFYFNYTYKFPGVFQTKWGSNNIEVKLSLTYKKSETESFKFDDLTGTVTAIDANKFTVAFNKIYEIPEETSEWTALENTNMYFLPANTSFIVNGMTFSKKDDPTTTYTTKFNYEATIKQCFNCVNDTEKEGIYEILDTSTEKLYESSEYVGCWGVTFSGGGDSPDYIVTNPIYGIKNLAEKSYNIVVDVQVEDGSKFIESTSAKEGISFDRGALGWYSYFTTVSTGTIDKPKIGLSFKDKETGEVLFEKPIDSKPIIYIEKKS